MTTFNKLTITSLVLTLLIAIAGWVYGLSNKVNTAEIKNIQQQIEQEIQIRADGDNLLSTKMDDFPNKMEQVLQNQASMEAKIDIIMKRMGL
jgi:hypothetical protein